MPQICQIVRTPSLMSVWWFWIPLSSSYPQRTWDALSVRRGVSLRGVSVLGQSERRREACGRGSSSHSTLSQLQHAFVQTQKSDCRSFTEVHSHVTHQMCLLKADSGRVARVRRLQLGVFLTHNAAFGNWMCVSCTLVVWSSNRESKVSGGRGRIFFFFLNRFAAGVAGVRLLSCTVRRHLYMLTDREERATLMLLLILLLAGYLWRGSPAVCSGVTCGRGNTASVEFTDLDSKRGHT